MATMRKMDTLFTSMTCCLFNSLPIIHSILLILPLLCALTSKGCYTIKIYISAIQLCSNFIWRPFHKTQIFPQNLASLKVVWNTAGAAVLLCWIACFDFSVLCSLSRYLLNIRVFFSVLCYCQQTYHHRMLKPL